MNCSAQPRLPLDHAHSRDAADELLGHRCCVECPTAIPCPPPSATRFPGSGQIRPETNHVQETANDPKIVTSSCVGFVVQTSQVMNKNTRTKILLASKT